jgi:hypothetical protein
MGRTIKLLWLAALMLTASVDAYAQNNSFATVIQNNSAMQSNLTNQAIALSRTVLQRLNGT